MSKRRQMMEQGIGHDQTWTGQGDNRGCDVGLDAAAAEVWRRVSRWEGVVWLTPPKPLESLICGMRDGQGLVDGSSVVEWTKGRRR